MYFLTRKSLTSQIHYRKQHGRLRVGGVPPWTLCAAAVERHVQAGGADGGDDPLLQQDGAETTQRREESSVRR